jgi:hypothetical protein
MYQQIEIGKNVCIFGYGSKISLLKSLRKKYFSSLNVWEVKGYLPSLNEKKIYNHFGSLLIQLKLI